MIMAIDGDGDEVDGEYVKWLLEIAWWYAAVIKDFIKSDLHKPN